MVLESKLFGGATTPFGLNDVPSMDMEKENRSDSWIW